MRKTNGVLQSSPSDLTSFIESPFTAWMDRHELEHPRIFTRDEEDESETLVQDKGNRHEQNVLLNLKKQFGKVYEVSSEGDFEARHADTVAAMKRGETVIYQAALRKLPFAGYADFLIRVPGESKLGDYHYETWDSKLAHSSKPYFILQLLAYSEMLAEIQGVMPRKITVVLGNHEQDVFLVDEFSDFFQTVKNRFLSFHDTFDKNQQPVPLKNETIRRWNNEAVKRIQSLDHLSQVANIRTHQIQTLEAAGVKTLAALATTQLSSIPEIEDGVFRKLKKQAEMQVKSLGKEKPEFEVLPHLVDTRIGLQNIPPPSEGDIYFDMEGYPLFEGGGLEYLFGLIVHEGKSTKFLDFWAHSRAQEKQAFEGFIDYVYARFKNYPNLHIYHYASYELSAVQKLSARHATREAEVDEILRAKLFIDLYKVVTQALVVGEPSYSIKYIEHLYMDKRQGDVTNAGASIVEYAKYLDQPDGATWETSKILKGIRDYNEDDCISTLKLTDWLRALQKERAFQYPLFETDRDSDSPESDAVAVSEAATLAAEILSRFEGKEELTEDERVQKLLAELLQFHRRERKEYWWKYFEWIKQDHQNLVEETECIGKIEKTGIPAEVKKSFECTYRFDPAQDVKQGTGSSGKLYVDEQNVVPCEITTLDSKLGLLTLKLGPKALEALDGEFPRVASILPSSPIKTDSIEASILETVKKANLQPALNDFLHRAYPAVKGRTGEPLAMNLEDVSKLDESTLCIQGPPGAGKTFSGSKVILELLKQGKKIAITSNTHQAIENLMKGAASVAAKAKYKIKVFKAGGEEKPELTDLGIETITTQQIAKVALNQDGGYIVGATAWGFSRDDVAEQFDYLFVDEAGQVSLANFVAIARCAKNLVLLGDQRQLEQPTQGTHPGESGKSCLTYLIQEHATIPPLLGVFLDKTYRMRPSVTEFISNAFYESRLLSDESSKTRELRLAKGLKLVTRAEGVLFVPEARGDYMQSNPAEAETILAIIQELKSSQFVDQDAARLITESDILVVAPYNLQVNLLKSMLPEGVQIGTVDKFQGGEAPIVILSMSASNLENAPKGIDFLFSPNRINVAISRAKCLAIVVGNPNLRAADATSIEKMRLVNLFCKLVRYGSE